MNIKGSNVLITGANRGIGLAIAEALAKKNAKIHLAIRKADPSLEANLLKLGAESVKVWNCDLTDQNQVNQLAIDLKTQNIDILVNNAGMLTGGLLETQEVNTIRDMFQVNLLSLVLLTRLLLPGMVERKRGMIVNNSSVSALMYFPGATTYAASKAAVYAFTNALEMELTDTGVSTLLLITPGVKTKMFDDIEVMYGKNLETPKDYITPQVYAEQIITAIETNKKILWPGGATRIGLLINKYLPELFKWEVRRRFKR